MTPRQKEIYKAILKYREKHGHSPTPAKLAGTKVSRQSVEKIVKQLIEKGVLRALKPINQGWFEPVDN